MTVSATTAFMLEEALRIARETDRILRSASTHQGTNSGHSMSDSDAASDDGPAITASSRRLQGSENNSGDVARVESSRGGDINNGNSDDRSNARSSSNYRDDPLPDSAEESNNMRQ